MSSGKSWFAKNIIDFSNESKTEDSIPDQAPPPNFSQPTGPAQPKPAYFNVPNPVPQVPSVAQAPISPAPTATVDMERFRTHVKELLRGANLPGPDYFEFIEGVDANGSLSLPRPTLFTMIYNSQKAMGLTKEKLISSANTYIKTIDDDYKGYQEIINKKKDVEVLGRDNTIKQLDQENATKMQQIQKLNEEIAQNNLKKQQLMVEKMDFESKIQSSQSQMQIVVETEKGKIKSDIELIQQVIQ